MKRKIIENSILFLIIILCFLTAGLVKKNAYDKNLQEAFHLDNNFSEIYLPQEIFKNTNAEDVYSVFKETAESTSAMIVGRLTNYRSEIISPGKVNPYKMISDVFFYTESPSNSSPSDVNIELNQHFPSILNDFFYTNVNFEKKELSHLPLIDYKNATFFVNTTDNKELESFCEKLSHHIKSQLDIEVPVETMKDIGNIERLVYTDNSVFTKYILFTALFILVFSTVYVSAEFNNMAILRLNGYSLIRILMHIIFKDIFVCTIIASVISSFIMFSSVHLPYLRIVAAGMVIFGMFQYCLTFFFMKSSLSNYLNNQNYSKNFLWFLYSIKLVTITLCIATIFPIIDLYSTYILPNETFDESENYAIFYPQVIGKDKKRLINGVELNIDNEEDIFYQQLNQGGLLYFDTSSLEAGLTPINQSLTINTNYLDKYPIYSVTGEPVAIDDSEEKQIVLIPEYFEPSILEITDYYELIDRNKRGTSYYLISNNQYLPNLHNNQILDKIPLIEVLTESNLPPNSILRGNSFENPFKVKINTSIEETYTELLPYMKKAEIDDELLSLVPINELKKFVLQNQIGSLTTSWIFIIFAFIILVFVIIFTINIQFYIYGKTYIIKRMNGYSLLKTYGVYFLTMFLQHFILSLLFISQGLTFSTLLATILVLIIIEFLVTVWNVFRLEKIYRIQVIKE